MDVDRRLHTPILPILTDMVKQYQRWHRRGGMSKTRASGRRLSVYSGVGSVGRGRFDRPTQVLSHIRLVAVAFHRGLCRPGRVEHPIRPIRELLAETARQREELPVHVRLRHALSLQLGEPHHGVGGARLAEDGVAFPSGTWHCTPSSAAATAHRVPAGSFITVRHCTSISMASMASRHGPARTDHADGSGGQEQCRLTVSHCPTSSSRTTAVRPASTCCGARIPPRWPLPGLDPVGICTVQRLPAG